MKNKYIGNSLVPSIGLGTWEIGGRYEPDFSHDDQHIKTLQYAIQLGLTHIDTAEMYGGGHTEELVGLAIQGFPRSSLFITSKVWGTHLRHNDLIKAVEKSLCRLKTNYIDLCLIHYPNPEIPLAETLKALNILTEQKVLKYIGVSNFNLELLEEACKQSSVPIAASQIEYNLFQRNLGIYSQDIECEILPFCQKKQIALIAWRPLGKDKFSVLAENPLLKHLAEKYNRTPAQIALNWLISQKNVFAIPKSVSPIHLKENHEAADFHLDSEDLASLSKNFPE